MKRVSKVNLDDANWFSRILYEAQIDNFYFKANRNISDDKRRNLKRKFRIERNRYPFSYWDDPTRDWLVDRQMDIEFGSRVYVREYGQPTTNIPVTFIPKPLPG